MSKTRAWFELTEERSKVQPRGVDYDLHQTIVQDLSVMRTRLKEEVSDTKGVCKHRAHFTRPNWPISCRGHSRDNCLLCLTAKPPYCDAAKPVPGVLCSKIDYTTEIILFCWTLAVFLEFCAQHYVLLGYKVNCKAFFLSLY